MHRFSIALAVFLLAGAVPCLSPAGAQTPPAAAPAPAAPAAKPSDEAMKAATQLTHLIGVDRQGQQLIAIMRGQMIQLVMRSGNKAQEEATKIVDELLMPDFNAQADELTQDIVTVWASNFTVQDLKGLQDFYNTPLGQKLIKTLPLVTQQGMAAGQAWGQRVYKASIEKHKDELIARGLKF